VEEASAVVERKEEDKAVSVSVEELELSVRSYNCLKRANINSLSDLLKLSDFDLMNIKNFGKKSAEEVLDKLETMGYSLRNRESSLSHSMDY
jgi:DNA-directed RNA polymerase subunit alpha